MTTLPAAQADEPRVVELVPPQMPSGVRPGAVPRLLEQDVPVPRGPVVHFHRTGERAGHRRAAAAPGDPLREVHQAAALRPGRDAGGDRPSDVLAHRRIGLQPLHEDLGEPAADVEPADLRQPRVLERREGNQIGAGGDQGLEVLGVIEGEGAIHGDADAHPTRPVSGCGVLSLRTSIALPPVRAMETSPSRHPFAAPGSFKRRFLMHRYGVLEGRCGASDCLNAIQIEMLRNCGTDALDDRR